MNSVTFAAEAAKASQLVTLVSQASAGGGGGAVSAGGGGITRIGPIELKIDGKRMKNWTIDVVNDEILRVKSKTFQKGG